MLMPGVKRIGDDEWEVSLSAAHGWFDTGVPMIVDKWAYVKTMQDSIWEARVGDYTGYSKRENGPPRLGFGFCDQPDKQYILKDHSFHDTIKLKVITPATGGPILFSVRVYPSQSATYHQDDDHMALHQPYIDWFNQKVGALSKQ